MKILQTILILSLICVFSPVKSQNACIDGTISISGNSATVLCLDDDSPDRIRFRSKPLAMPYAYLVVNEQDIIVHVGTSNWIDFGDLPGGILRVVSFSFLGNVTAEIGDNYLETELAALCYQLVSNHITISNSIPVGGNVSADGATAVTLCLNEDIDHSLDISSDSDFASYTYVITDDNNVILGVSPDGHVDFSEAPTGVCRVWGLAYVGDLNAPLDANLLELELANGCYELSNNYVEVTRLNPEAGTLSYGDGSTSFTSCSELEPNGSLELISTNTGTTPFTYIMVDIENNSITDIFAGSSIDLASLASGSFQLYGLAYSGALTAQVGDPFNIDQLSDDCQDVSNPISLIKRVQHADDVNLSDGSSAITICVDDGIADELTFVSTYAGNDSFVYLITDESNFLLAISPTGVIDFEDATPGVCRVWGLAYSGDLTVTEGENIGTPTLLSDECFDLSDGFVTVDRNGAEAGNITFADGSTSYFSCTALPPSGDLEFQVSGHDGSSNYTFVVVNSDDNRITLLTDTSIDLAELNDGTYTVFGVAYFGDLGLMVGDDFNIDNSSASCSDVTGSGLELIRRVQHADDITLEDGSTEATICTGDGFPDELTFVSTYVGNDNFLFVITDESNFVIGTSETGIIDFEGADPGLCRIWGLVYSGNLTLEEGDNLGGGQPLSDECYDLSDGFSIVNRHHPDGGFISLLDGSTSYTECNAASTTLNLEFATENAEPNLAYSYIVVDAQSNTVVAILIEPSLDLTDFGFGTYDVYGISYLGNLTVSVGDQFGSSAMSDVCFDLSDNTVEIINRFVDVNHIQIVGGATTSTICPGGGPDIIVFESDYSGTDNLVYIITDEDNVILQLLAAPSTNFDVPGPDIVRVWAVATTGNFLLTIGSVLDANTQITDDCYDISDNFVLIDKRGPQGGTITLANGQTSADVCVSDGLPDILTVSTTGLGAGYAYVITDENDIILGVSESNEIDFEDADPGECHIWSVSYVGDLNFIDGVDIQTANLANGCFALSDNFITVNRTFVDGGTVTLENGETSTFACGGDGNPDFFIFNHTTSAGDASYSFIITDDQENILAVLDGNSVDLELAAPGECHVWGVSHTGDIIASIGQNAADVALSNECYELSSNFIMIQRDQVIGGSVSLTDGNTIINICPNDDTPDLLSFINTGMTTGTYTYILTDVNNNFLSNISTGEFDFNDISAPEEVRVWGLAYSGLLSSSPGDVEETMLSNRCYDLSSNFVTIIRETPNGGNVSTTDGDTALYLCTDDGFADLFSFEASGASNTDYAFIITNDENTILGLLTNTNSNDFEGAPNGTCRVWGVAYTGTLLAQVDDNIDDISLSNDCYDLSANFVEVVRGGLNAGSVSTTFGLTEQFTCPGDDIDDIVSMTNQDAGTGTYAYVLTDENDTVLEVLTDGTVNFNIEAEGTYHIWGLIYTGDLLLPGEGENLTDATLASGCFDLSDNFVNIINIAPAAGTLTVDGQSEIALCIGDGVSDLMELEVAGESGAAYAFLVIEADSFLVGALTDPMVDFDLAAPGNWLIYGISYTGSLNVLPGANIYTDVLSNGCYELTEFPLVVNKTQVDGGDIFTSTGSQVVYSCPNGESDIIDFINSGISTEADYIYVLTTQSNAILSVLTGNSIDLSLAAGLSELRMWGVSYTGTWLPTIGQNITTEVLSDGCYVLSDNSVEIFIDNPNGGMLSLANGETSIDFCHSNSMPGVVTVTTTSSDAGYIYILADEMDETIDVSTSPDGFVSFDNVAPGTYHVWGLSYTGNLLLEPGDTVTHADVLLASSCFELSENFVTVERSESLDAGDISTANGEENLYFCPGDDQVDLVVLSYDSQEPNFAYFMTDENGNIVVADIEGDIIDFNAAPAGIYYIYGIAYTGELTLNFMDNINDAALSTECWALSNNFLEVVNEAPASTSISTIDGETAVELTVGDGIADEVEFMQIGWPFGLYSYIITDEDNVIIAISSSATVDFDGASPGVCRVWGIAYTGSITAQQGDDLDEVSISNDCYQLSDNFVTVNRTGTEGIQGEEEWFAGIDMPQVNIALSPNPTSDLLMVNISVPGEGPTAAQSLDIYNVNGLRILSTPLSPTTGNQDTSLDVSNLESGMYLLRWFDGERVVMTRFVKQ